MVNRYDSRSESFYILCDDQCFPADGTESRRWINDRLMALMTLVDQLLAAHCAELGPAGVVDEIPTGRTELVSFFDDESFGRFLGALVHLTFDVEEENKRASACLFSCQKYASHECEEMAWKITMHSPEVRQLETPVSRGEMSVSVKSLVGSRRGGGSEMKAAGPPRMCCSLTRTFTRTQARKPGLQ